MIRQGDVLIVPVAEIPGAVRRETKGPAVVAFGEVTGHGHGWDDGVALLDAPDGTVYVENPMGLPLVHGHVTASAIETLPVVEHAPIPAPRLGEVRLQVEYAEQDVRQVMD